MCFNYLARIQTAPLHAEGIGVKPFPLFKCYSEESKPASFSADRSVGCLFGKELSGPLPVSSVFRKKYFICASAPPLGEGWDYGALGLGSFAA